MALNKAKIITVTSVKGGVGKTTTVLNLAGVYSNLGNKVLLIDLDIYSGDIAAILNLKYQRDIYNMYEDLENKKFDSFENYISKYNSNIDILPAPKDPRYGRRINSNVLNTIFYKTVMKYDVILIDTNHILTDINLFALDSSDQILYVINNDSMNLKNMKNMVAILSNMNKKNYKIVLNESTCKGKNYYNKYDIKNIINKNVNYIIPDSFYLKDIDKYIVNGKILILDNYIYKKHKKTMKIFNLMANDLIKEEKGE